MGRDMGWLSDLLGRSKRVTDNVRYIGATVPPADAASRYSAKDRGAQEMIARAAQWVEVCARRNASECASNALRLYVPARGGNAKRGWAKRVTDTARLKYLRHPTRGPGQKSAMYAEMAGDVEEVLDHPLLDLLRKPNPWMRYSEWFSYNYYSLDLTGNRYWHVVMPNGEQPMQLYPMAPQCTRVVPSVTDFIAGYIYGRNGTVEDEFATDEVLHAKHAPSLHSPYYGVGPLAAMFGEADIDQASLQTELALYQNGARPDFAMTVPPETPRTETEAMAASLESKFRGPSKRGKILITTAAELKPIQWSNREMEAIALIKNVEARIWACFGIPESEVRLNDANLASSLTGNVQYQRQTIKPRLTAQAEEMTETLLPLFGITPGEMWLCYDNNVPSDEAATATRMVSLYAGRLLTKNEARAELGYDMVDGGDDFDQPAPSLGGFGQDPAADPSNDTPPAEDAAQEDSAAKAAACPGCGTTHKHITTLRRTKNLHEIGLNLTQGLFFDGAVNRLLMALNTAIPNVMRGGQVDVEDLIKQLDPAIESFQFPSLQIGWNKAAEELRQMAPPQITMGLNVVPTYAIDALERRRVNVANDIGNTVSNDVTKAIQNALEQGSTRPEAIQQVAMALGTGNRDKAALIADTEISRAYIMGNATVYKEAGVERTEWATAADPCPICEAAAEAWNSKAMDMQASMEELISGSYATLDNPKPPQHPRCRCSLLPIVPKSWGGTE